jgi:hypothetical protein
MDTQQGGGSKGEMDFFPLIFSFFFLSKVFSSCVVKLAS